jgi:hypothetical protein
MDANSPDGYEDEVSKHGDGVGPESDSHPQANELIFNWPGIEMGPGDWDRFLTQNEFSIGADHETFKFHLNPHQARETAEKGSVKKNSAEPEFYSKSVWVYRAEGREKKRLEAEQPKNNEATERPAEGIRFFEPPSLSITRHFKGSFERQVALLSLKLDNFETLKTKLDSALDSPSYRYSDGLDACSHQDPIDFRRLAPSVL